MNKKKIIIILPIIIVLIITTIACVVGAKVNKENKISTFLQLGINYLTDEHYDKAKLEFSNALAINTNHKEANELLNLTENYIKIKQLYEDNEYNLALELISKIKKNNSLIHIEEKFNELSLNIDEKIFILNEINTLDTSINQLINENKYYEAIELVNKFLKEDLNEEYLNKLNILITAINDSKTIYEDEQIRLSEERRLAEEQLEEKRKAAEQQKAESTIVNQIDDLSSKMISKARVKEILDGRINSLEITFENYDNPIVFEKNGIVYWAYKQIWQGESDSFLIIDMFSGKVIVSEKLDFIHDEADFYYPGY